MIVSLANWRATKKPVFQRWKLSSYLAHESVVGLLDLRTGRAARYRDYR
jgi:hypothetical protein